MLAEADTIQKAKELKGLALTASEWAKRKNMGEDAILHCRSYALEAERKMGQMLAETERAKGTKCQLHGKDASGGARVLPPEIRRPAAGLSNSDALKNAPTLADLGISKRESAEAQKLAAIPASRFDALKAGETTKKQALSPVHVSNNSGENEWYTPKEYIDAAHDALETIDLDPASSEIANATVKAKTFYTAAQNGLEQKWRGRVWMNPPYAQPLIAQFCAKLAESIESGTVTEAIALVNNATETAWFNSLAEKASAICFPRGRIKFVDMNGHPGGAPLQGQAAIYMGDNPKKFAAAFRKFGIILWGK